MNTRRRLVPALAIVIALVALALRLHRLDGVPPGLQHDEVFHGHDAVTVLLGNHPIYFPSNAGNEPLYIYLTAGTIAAFGKNAWGIRLAAVLCGLATVAFTGLWTRRTFNTRTALIASALAAVTFWPLFMSRVGLRSAALPPLAAATAWLFWRAAAAPSRAKVPAFILAGIGLGAALYTYPAARSLPVAYLMFVVAYLAIGLWPKIRPYASRRLSRFTPWLRLSRDRQRPAAAAGPVRVSTVALNPVRTTLYDPLALIPGFVVFLLTAGLVFLPLYLYLSRAPEADVRIQQLLTIGAMSALQKGNPGPLLANIRDTLGMFIFRGDPVWRYNIAGRPVFDPLTSALFLLGLLVALRRIRQPRYLFALIWLPTGLLPSILSDSAPSFLRASASLPVTFLVPALGADWLIERFPRWERQLAVLVTLVVVLGGALSARDYFSVWPNRPEVQSVYRTDLASIAHWLDGRAGDEPAVVASTNPHDVDPFLFDFELRRPRRIQWVDHAYGLILPSGQALYLSPAFTPLAPELRDLLGNAPVVSPAQAPFVAYETSQPTITLRAAPASPVRFGNWLELVGYQMPASIKPGEWVRVWTAWRVVQDTGGEQWPIAVFVHLLDAQGQFVEGRDLLAVPTAGWRTGDMWVQFQDIPAAQNIKPGVYSVEIGVYSRADMKRWPLPDGADRLLLGSVKVR